MNDSQSMERLIVSISHIVVTVAVITAATILAVEHSVSGEAALVLIGAAAGIGGAGAYAAGNAADAARTTQTLVTNGYAHPVPPINVYSGSAPSQTAPVAVPAPPDPARPVAGTVQADPAASPGGGE